MAKKVTAKGKTFTFDDNVTNDQIGSVIDEYFSGIEKKSEVQPVLPTGTQPSKRGFEPFLPQVPTKAPSVLTPKGQVDYQEQVKDFKPVVQKQPPLPKAEKPLSNLESIKNTVYNVANSLKGVLPRLSLTSVDVFEKVIGKDLTGRLASLPRIEFSNDGIDIVTGRTPEQIRNESIQSLDYLNTQVAPTAGIVENVRNFNIPGLAAGVIDAAGGLVSTIIPSALSGGSLLVTEMVGGGLYDYNTAKAKSKGVSTEDLYKSGDADFGVPAAIGGVAYSMERIGLKGFTNAISKKLAGSGFKKALLLGTEWNKEGLTEWVQVGLDEANLALANGLSVEDAAIAAADKMSSVEGLEAYAKGFAGSAAASGTARVVKRLVSPKNKTKASELEQQKNQSLQDLANENIPIEAKNAILDVLENTNEQIDDLVNIDRKEVEQLSESQAGRVGEINEKIENIDLAINDANISESTKTILEKQKQELDSELDAIIAAPEIKLAKPTFDTEESLTEEIRAAEKEFNETGDSAEYQLKINDLNTRLENLVPAPEDAEIEDIGKSYPSPAIVVKKFNPEEANELLTGEDYDYQLQRIERTIASGIKAGETAKQIRERLGANGHVFNLGSDNETVVNYIKKRIDGTENRPFQDFAKNTRNKPTSKEAEIGKPEEVAIQEEGLQEPTEITTFGNEKIKPNIISEGAQKEQRVNTKAIRNFKEKDTIERNNSSIQNWLDSIGRSYKKEEGNEGEELFRESVFDKESQSGVLLDDIYRKWQSLRAQALNEPKVGESVAASRARAPLEQQRVGQQNRELAIIDKLRAQEVAQQDSEQGNISEDSRKKQIEAGRMVEEIFELSSLPNDPKKAPVARALRNLLSSSTQKEKQLIINEIKNKLYAISQSISSKVPVQPEATVSEEVEQGKPEAKPKVAAEEGKEEVEPEFTNQEDYDTYRIDKTEDLDEIAFIHYNNQSEPDYKVEGVRDYIGSKGKINAKDYARYGDTNNLTPEIKRRFIDSTNKSGSLDTQAMELSEQLGIEVEPADFIDFVTDYSSMKGYEAKTKNKVQARAEQRYYELTGKKLTPKRAEAGYLKIKNKPKTNEELYKLNEDLQEIGITYEDIERYEDYSKQESERIEEDLRKSESVGTTSTVDGKQDKGVQEQKVDTLEKPIKIFKGLIGKKNADGTVRTAHPNVKGVFASSDIKVAERYSEDGSPIKEFNIPSGTTLETVQVKNTNQGLKAIREQETELINNSKAQIVKLITIDAKGREEQYVIKDKNLLQEEKAPALKDVESTAKALEDELNKNPKIAEQLLNAKNVDKFNQLTDPQKKHLERINKMSADEVVDKLNELRFTPDNLPLQYELSRHNFDLSVDENGEWVSTKTERKEGDLDFDELMDRWYLTITPISEAYHKAKKDGSNPELVKAVEDLLSEPKAESVKKEFTEGKDLNRVFAESKKKYGDKEGSKYNDVVNRLVNPNQNTIIEVRSNGVVVKEGDKYLLKPFTNTDANYKKWELARPLDVTDQYVTQKAEPKLTKIEEAQKEADTAVKDLLDFVKKSRGTATSFANVGDFGAKMAKVIAAYAKLGIVKLEDVIAKLRQDVGDEFVDENKDAITDAWNEANGGKKKVESDFEETAPIFEEVKADGKASDEFVRLTHKNIESDEFKNTLSNKERESGRELSKEAKEYRVKALMDAFQLGNDIIEQAKQEFGDKYVENLLAFIRDNANTLGVDNTSLILLSLENDLNKQMLDDPENLTLKKQENLVQNITIKYQRTVARALGLGRLRQLARVGYDIEAVTDQFFTTKQLEGKRKVEKAIQSDMDAINEEAEAQEQETESEFLDEDIQRLIEEGVESELAKLKVTMPTKRREKADKAIAAIEKFQKKLRGLTYESTIGVPIAIIDSGLTTIKVAIDKGVNVADAIELGIKRIKRDYKKTWDKEDKFRKDMLDFFKKEGVELKEGKRVLTEEQKRKMYIKRLEKDLADLDTQIEEKKRKVVTREDKYKNDQEIQSLRETKEAKQELLNKIDPTYAEQIKLKNDLKSAQESLNEYERRIKENDFESTAKPTPTQIDAKLKELRDKRDKAKQDYQDKKKAYEASLITPESIEEKKIDSEIKATEKSIAELERRLAEKDFSSDTKTQSVWTQKIGELKQKQSELRQKLIEERNKLIEKQAPKDRLEQAKDNVKARIETLQQEIADKRKELKVQNKLTTDTELESFLAQEQALKEIAKQYLTQESIDRINESKEKAVITKLENDVNTLNTQIIKGEKDAKEAKKDPLDTPEITKLKAEKEAKMALLESLDPNPKEFTKTALIEAGYGREITVTTKNGKEKRQVLDWKKLAGEEGSIQNIQDIVEKSLKGKGFSNAQISRMQNAFVNEYKDLRASIIAKSLNELNRLNTPKEPVNVRSSARRLAELYDLGLFEKKSDTYDYLMNRALGMSSIGQDAYFKAKKLAGALSELYKRPIFGKKIKDNEIFIKTAVRDINQKIEELLNIVVFNQAPLPVKVVKIIGMYLDLSTRTMLQSLKNAMQNMSSGAYQTLLTEAGYLFSKSDTSSLAKQRYKLGAMIYKDITLNGGVFYGDISTPLVTQSQIENWINKQSTYKVYHAVISFSLGRGYLEAADSMNKAILTEKYFIYALVKVLSNPTNPNRMSKDDALKYVSEQLTGQKYEQAVSEAKTIVDEVNNKVGRVVLRTNKEAVERLAMDIVKASLLENQVVTQNLVKASFNSAYKAAGFDLGHESNNFISKALNSYSISIQNSLEEATKNRQWGRAIALQLSDMLNRNVVNTFVGGGTNWLFLTLQKNGLDVVSPIVWYLNAMGKMDLSTPEGVKLVEKKLYADFQSKNTNIRVLVSGLAMGAVYAVMSDDEDEFEAWLKKNEWARKLAMVYTPLLLEGSMAYRNDKLELFLTKLANRQYDNGGEFIKSLVGLTKGGQPSRDKALGQIGGMVGSRLNVPMLPYRMVKDLDGIYRGIKGYPVLKYDFNPIGFWDGYFNNGAIDYVGLKVERNFARNIENVIPSSDTETKSFLYENNLTIDSNSDKEVLSKDGLRNLSINEAKKYDKLWSEEVYKSIKTNMPKLKDLSEKQIKSFISAIEYSATQKVQKEFGFQDPVLQQIEINDVKYSLDKKQIEKRNKLIKEYIRDKKGSLQFDDSFKQAVKDGRVVNTPEAKNKMLMSNAKAHATKEMKILLEGKTKTLQVAPD